MSDWAPKIGDPTAEGWLTVAAYAVAAWLCWRAMESAPRPERRTWLLLAAAMAILSINKQLDLQSLLTAAGRDLARAQGWYESRHVAQQIFVAAIVGTGLVAFLLVLRLFRRASLPLQGALAGALLLALFIVARASSFNKVDILINSGLAGVRVNHAIELGGIALVAICALAATQVKKRKRQRQRSRGSRGQA